MNRSAPRRLWFLWHSWLALPIWVFLLFVCVTGTIATIDKEILWLIDPAVRADHENGTVRKPLNAVAEDIHRQLPNAAIAGIAFGEPYMALKVSLYTPDGADTTAWVNPYSGIIQRISHGINFSDFVVSLHGWLLMPWTKGTPIGWYAVTLLGVPLLGSAITGMVIFKRFWRTYITWPKLRFRQGARLFWGDLHRLAGAWSLWFIIIIAVTGLWFLVRGVMYDLHVPVGMEAPDIPRREVPSRKAGEPLPEIDIDGALAAVRTARPETRPLAVILPEHARGTISVYSRSAFPLLAEEAWVHPYSGDVLMVRDWRNARTSEVISTLNASLHFGNFAGLPVKLVWTFFGALLSTLVATGTVIGARRAAKASREILATASPLAGGPRRARFRWRFYLGGLVLILPLMSFPRYFTEVSAPPLGAHILPGREVGPFRVTLAEVIPGAPRLSEQGGLLKDYALHIENGYPDRIRLAYLRRGKPPHERNLGEILEGNPYRLHGKVRFPPTLKSSDSLWLTIEEWDGTLHQTSWPLAEVMQGVTFGGES
ncbi:PepSY-associated TM helix domain-containing protein [Telmatospirillum siberiense]|nr:PepSY-associated TM helix domain-containing protein [Telmatospirillum siberiense]